MCKSLFITGVGGGGGMEHSFLLPRGGSCLLPGETVITGGAVVYQGKQFITRGALVYYQGGGGADVYYKGQQLFIIVRAVVYSCGSSCLLLGLQLLLGGAIVYYWGSSCLLPGSILPRGAVIYYQEIVYQGEQLFITGRAVVYYQGEQLFY